MKKPKRGQQVLVYWADISANPVWQDPDDPLGEPSGFENIEVYGRFLGIRKHRKHTYWVVATCCNITDEGGFLTLSRVGSTYDIPSGAIRGWAPLKERKRHA